MEVTISSGIFSELDRCSVSNELLDFTMPADLDDPISIYPSEYEIHDINLEEKMDELIKKQVERNFAISGELRKLLRRVPLEIQSAMISAAGALEFMSGYISGLSKRAETNGNFFQTLSEEDNVTMTSALLEYRSHLGEALDGYYRVAELTPTIREYAAETVNAINKVNEWITELDEGRKKYGKKIC